MHHCSQVLNWNIKSFAWPEILPAAVPMHACVHIHTHTYTNTHTRKHFAWVHACPLCARTWTCKCVRLCVYCTAMSVCVSVQSACPQGAHAVTDCPTGFINQLLLGATWKHSSTCVQQTELRSVVALLGYSGSNNLSVCLHTQQKEVFISTLYFSHTPAFIKSLFFAVEEVHSLKYPSRIFVHM